MIRTARTAMRQLSPFDDQRTECIVNPLHFLTARGMTPDRADALSSAEIAQINVRGDDVSHPIDSWLQSFLRDQKWE